MTDAQAQLAVSPGRVCHFTLSSTVIDYHSLEVYIVTLLSLLSLSVQMTDSPMATETTIRVPAPGEGMRAASISGVARPRSPASSPAPVSSAPDGGT